MTAAGFEARIACATCGTALRPTAKFCDECGSSVTAAAAPAEYKQVTVLFADVVHSMDIAAAVGAERLREIMSELVGRAAAVVQRFGGTVDKFTGDGIMAVFGAPVALEDHAFRACLAALGSGDDFTLAWFRGTYRLGGGNGVTQVLTVIGVGGMGYAIARRLGAGKTVLLADYNEETLTSVAESLSADGHHVESRRVDVSSPESVRGLAEYAASLGDVTQLAHTAGLSPSQASAEAILAVDLLGVALVLEEFGEVIAPGGTGVVIASMSGNLVPPLPAEQEHALANTPSHELLQLDFVRKISHPGIAYAIAKHANHIRVRAASAHWGRRGARINSISPGIISTPMGRYELASPLGEGMRAMLASSAVNRLGTADDIAAATAFLLGPEAAFITGIDLLVDGGIVAAIKSQTR